MVCGWGEFDFYLVWFDSVCFWEGIFWLGDFFLLVLFAGLCCCCYGLFSCFVFLHTQSLLCVSWTWIDPTNIHYSPRKLSTRSLNTSRMAALQPRQPVQIPLLLRPGKRPRRRSRCILVSCDLLLWFDGCPVTLLTRLRCDRRYEDA